MNKMDKDSTQHHAASGDKDIKAVAVVYTNVDAKAAASIKAIVDLYLHIKMHWQMTMPVKQQGVQKLWKMPLVSWTNHC